MNKRVACGTVGKDRRKQKGQWAEEEAVRILTELGYRIVLRNWRCRSGEIDIIAEDEGDIVFVEVRSRSSYASAFGTAMESITPRKIAQVRATASVYLHHMQSSQRAVRFDVVAITLGAHNKVEHFEHIRHAF
ncbi:putative endonuclease [Paenibacillus shirakamiensis]|uniref:UPF0102 protein J2Z69_002181 n=1 Tax=Paenibacillus shirakamiensis TaxID=1265935 RepID=A0ABS4JHD8_9BACL|nr:putative endonuclease [Paenibacillus shirakamiensis]